MESVIFKVGILAMLCTVNMFPGGVCADDTSIQKLLAKHESELGTLKDLILGLRQRDDELSKTVLKLVNDNEVHSDKIQKLEAENEMLLTIVKEMEQDKRESSDNVGQEHLGSEAAGVWLPELKPCFEKVDTLQRVVETLQQTVEDLAERHMPVQENENDREVVSEITDKTGHVKTIPVDKKLSHDMESDKELLVDEMDMGGKAVKPSDHEKETQQAEDSGIGSNMPQKPQGSPSVNQKRLLAYDPVTDGREERAAFTAKMTDHMTELVNNDQALIFDSVLTNIGNNYSPLSGIFTATSDGTYFFLACIMSYTNEFIFAEIVVNGHGQVNLYSYDESHKQSTNGVVLNLHKGDDVWVIHMDFSSDTNYGGEYSTFSGFQIA